MAQRDGLHLVDRALAGGGVGADLLLAALREVSVAVRLLVVGQADACVGHDRLAAAGLDRGRAGAVPAGAVQLVAVEGVVARKLVAHLVGDVVDRVQVADRSRDARAAAGLVRAAHDAEVGDAAARLAEREVADVVAARTDDLADHVARASRARAARDLRLREACSRAAGAVRRRRQVVRVEVQIVVARDQLQPDRQVVLVDLVDSVDERDLRGRDVRRAAEVRRVARIRDQRQAVGAELLADVRSRVASGERPVRGAQLVLDEGSVGLLASRV